MIIGDKLIKMREIKTRCDVRWELSKKWGALVSWGCSSVGRALDLHSRGLGFNSPQLHIFIFTPSPSHHIRTQPSISSESPLYHMHNEHNMAIKT